MFSYIYKKKKEVKTLIMYIITKYIICYKLIIMYPNQNKGPETTPFSCLVFKTYIRGYTVILYHKKPEFQSYLPIAQEL